MDNATEQTTLSVCADLLKQNTKIHLLSAGITVTSLIALLILGILHLLSITLILQLLLIISLGIAETIMSVRVGFDAALLRQLSKTHTNVPASLATLDKALVKLKLMPANKTGRELDIRVMSCMKLFKTQILFCVIQVIAIPCFGAIAMYL